MSKIYCIGEALVDFVPSVRGVRLEEVPAFVRAPGGAPYNLAAAVCKLGAQAAFMGMVGDDAFGRLLRETLDSFGVDTAHMAVTAKANTTLAFVALKADGDRDFIFYRKPGADMLLGEDDIPEALFQKGDILHFGSLGLVPMPTKSAHDKALRMMRAAGGIISFDPNVRLDLWDDHALCRSTILEYLPHADIVKVSLDEMPFIFGTEDEQAVAERCFALRAKLVMITRGADGSAMYIPGYKREIVAIDVKVEDTTGAGDAYTGAVLADIAANPDAAIDAGRVDAMIEFANIVGSITTMCKGGAESVPTREQAAAFVAGMKG